MIEAILRGARFDRILTQDRGTETVFTLKGHGGGVQGKLINDGMGEGNGLDGKVAAFRHGRQHDQYDRLVADKVKLPDDQKRLWGEALDRTGQDTNLPSEVRHSHDLIKDG